MTEYKVSAILAHKSTSDGRKYNVSWVGYSDTTWEPRTNLDHLELLGDYEYEKGLLAGRSVNYEVDVVVKSRGVGKQRKFLVKWKGFTAKYNTWEPQSNLSNAGKLLKEFMAKNNESPKKSPQKKAKKSPKKVRKVPKKPKKSPKKAKTSPRKTRGRPKTNKKSPKRKASKKRGDISPSRAVKRMLASRTRLKPVKKVSDEDVFVVEAVTGVRGPRLHREFHVKWKGFPHSGNTWEPETTLKEDGVGHLIKKFMSAKGV